MLAEHLWWKVALKLSANNTRITMLEGDGAPVDGLLTILLDDGCNLLANIELGLLLGFNTLDLKKSLIGVEDVAAAAERNEGRWNEEGSLRHSKGRPNRLTII